MLVIGGAFGIVMRTGTVDNGILALIRHTACTKVLFIPVLFVPLFASAVFLVLGEEAVVCNYHSPLAVVPGRAQHYFTVRQPFYLPPKLAFASSWMNLLRSRRPWSRRAVLFQPGPRIVVRIVATLITGFTLVHASRVKRIRCRPASTNPIATRTAG